MEFFEPFPESPGFIPGDFRDPSRGPRDSSPGLPGFFLILKKRAELPENLHFIYFKVWHIMVHLNYARDEERKMIREKEIKSEEIHARLSEKHKARLLEICRNKRRSVTSQIIYWIERESLAEQKFSELNVG